jgi:hypothetical protein
MRKFLALMTLLLSSISMAEAAAGYKLTCDAPATRTNGNALASSEIAGYLFFLTQGGAPQSISTLQTTCSLQYVVPKDATVAATDTFTVVAVDTANNASSPSNAVPAGVAVSGPKSPPSAPTNLKVLAF